MKTAQVRFLKGVIKQSTGSIGIEELEKPLISLGLCRTREDVKKIMDEVDEDGSGQIEFNEFLHIIKSAS